MKHALMVEHITAFNTNPYVMFDSEDTGLPDSVIQVLSRPFVLLRPFACKQVA